MSNITTTRWLVREEIIQVSLSSADGRSFSSSSGNGLSASGVRTATAGDLPGTAARLQHVTTRRLHRYSISCTAQAETQ